MIGFDVNVGVPSEASPRLSAPLVQCHRGIGALTSLLSSLTSERISLGAVLFEAENAHPLCNEAIRPVTRLRSWIHINDGHNR